MQKTYHIGSQTFMAYQITTQKTNAFLIMGQRGFLACAYFDIAIAEKVGDAAAIVTGVRSFDDMLTAHVVHVSSAATLLGVTPGMTGQEALLRLS